MQQNTRAEAKIFLSCDAKALSKNALRLRPCRLNLLRSEVDLNFSYVAGFDPVYSLVALLMPRSLPL